LERNQLSRDRSRTIEFAVPPAIRDPKIAARPSEPLESLPERGDLRLCLWVVLGVPHQHAQATHTFGLLRARRERPRCRAAEKRNEIAPPQVEHATISHGTLSLQ
jgi:hypothetical protein